MHVVVVGAGILGASIAYHLTLHGVRVTIVDAGQPGEGATRVAFAWLNAYGKTPFSYHDLNRRSIDMWAGFARRLGIDVTWGGELLGGDGRRVGGVGRTGGSAASVGLSDAHPGR